MEKLIEKFENIIENHAGGDYCNEVMVGDSGKICAEEAKKLTLNFTNWYITNGITLGFQGGARYTDPEFIFDKFIGEEYGE